MFDSKNDWLKARVINNALITGLCLSLVNCAALAQSESGYGVSNVKTESGRTSANLHSSHNGRSLHATTVRPRSRSAVSSRPPARINHPWGLTPNDSSDRSNQKKLPETEKLIHNDSLFPGQNRTQAMILESESGHINPQEDSALAPKKNTNNQHKANK
jgi:hypothetical protein